MKLIYFKIPMKKDSKDEAYEALEYLFTEPRDELGVSIGRTSFKLRNPKNEPPEWSKSFVKARIDKPQYVELANGKLGALLPIVLQPKCVTCHGPQDTLAEDVRTALAERYPNDRATGFQAGDLRGWFWVEVPNLSKTK